MAAAQLLSIAKTAANSADIPVVAGTPVTIALKITAGEIMPARTFISVTLKDDGGVYNFVGALSTKVRALTIVGPGTYRVERPTISNVDSSGVGVFSG